MELKQPKNKIYKRWWFWVLVVLILFIIIGLSSGSNSSQPSTTQTAPVSTATNTKNSSTQKISNVAEPTVTTSKTNNQTNNPVSAPAVVISAPAGSDFLITEPSAGITPFLTAISGATKSIDLVMYELQDSADRSRTSRGSKSGR